MKQATKPQERSWYTSWRKRLPYSLNYPELLLFELLVRASNQWPTTVAFCCEEKNLTYSELDDLSSRFSSFLAELGVEKGRKGPLVPAQLR